MARVDVLHHAFNVGQFDRDKLHRVDIDRMRLAAEVQTNFLCDAVGKAYPRPGFAYYGTLPGDARPMTFVSGNGTSAALLYSDMAMRVYDQASAQIITRAAVGTVVQSGDFSAATGWTLAATAGQSTTVSGGKLNMAARARGGKAVASQQVTVAPADLNHEHGLRIVVDRGPVMFKAGSIAGGDDYVAFSSLRKGVHSLAITPTGDIFLEFSSELSPTKIVDSCSIEGAGVMSIPTLWPAAAIDLVREAQSLDVLFCAADGYKEQRIERRGTRSWSVCDEDRDDGPFQAARNAQVTLTPSVLEGNGTLTASAPFFRATHVGAIFRLFHVGQKLDTYIAAENQFTDPISITGITEANFEERKYTYTIAGTWAGTIRNSRSFDGEDGAYHDMRNAQTVATIDITGNTTLTNDDNDDNVDEWVRLGFPSGLYTSGEAHITATYTNGGGFGIARVVGYTSPTQVDIEVLTPFKGLGPVTDWREGRYDGYVGYPSAVSFDDGRLTWSGNDIFDASISDAYDSFDETFEGDAGPLSRSIALSGRNKVRWSLALSSLMLGCDQRIANVRASSLDEILTPDNTGVKSSGKIGAAPISPVELADDRLIFAQASRVSLYEVTWAADKARYVTAPFSKLTTEMFTTGINALAVQVLPDQRLWVGNAAADAVCIVFEPSEQVLAAHVGISTSTDTDFFRRFAVLPADDQDQVVAVVKRVVGGVTVYYFEVMAKDTEARVDTVSKCMDSYVTGTGAHAAIIAGLNHLEGRTVVAWVDGAPVTDPAITDPAVSNTKSFVVAGGQITLPTPPAAGYCVGLPYQWKYKSARLAYGVQGYTPMLKNKALAAIGLIMSDFVRDGVYYGVVRDSSFSAPWNLPVISSATGLAGAMVNPGPGADETSFPAGSDFDLDVRLCISGASPKPFTLDSLVLGIETLRG